jgi:hypothetical protein
MRLGERGLQFVAAQSVSGNPQGSYKYSLGRVKRTRGQETSLMSVSFA